MVQALPSSHGSVLWYSDTPSRHRRCPWCTHCRRRNWLPPLVQAEAAHIPNSAGISIITGHPVGSIPQRLHHNCRQCTGCHHCNSGQCLPHTPPNGIRCGTGIAVITGHGVRDVFTSHKGSAHVTRAEVVVITVRGGSRLTHRGLAHIAHGAGVVVIAGEDIGGIETTGGRVTGIIRTDIAVITGEGWPSHADLGGAGIRSGAGVPIITTEGIGHVHTSLGGITTVIGARVVVVAVYRCSPTGSRDACVSSSAGGFVIADRARQAAKCILRLDHNWRMYKGFHPRNLHPLRHTPR